MPTPIWQDLDGEARASSERTRRASEDWHVTQRTRLTWWLVVALVIALVVAGVVILTLQR